MFGFNSGVGIVFLFVAVWSTEAFFFSRTDRVASSNGRAVNQSCLAQADAGNCGFYSCFEQRLPCGRNWYMLKQGLFYCNMIERDIGQFSEQAQVFLRDSRRCMMQSLKVSYAVDTLSCHDLEHEAIEAISECFIDNAFCSALHGNYMQFFNIYESSDLISSGAGKVWTEIAGLAFHCGGEALSSLSSIARERVSSGLDNLANSVRSRFSNLFNGK